VLSEPPGSYAICQLCFWEDDPVQLRHPQAPGGANGVSLIEAQINYRTFGASERRFLQNCRARDAGDVRDPEWRPIDLERDRFEAWEGCLADDFGEGPRTRWPRDMTMLYYWRDTFWRRTGN
jgi:hypothetical protein